MTKGTSPGSPTASSGGHSTGALVSEGLSALDQMRMFEEKYDPLTTEILQGLPIDPTWNCLDIGAGAGSMSYWLAERVERGSVLAVDVETEYLDSERMPNMSVRQSDITREEFEPGSFDLILARALFEHLPSPEEQLARATGWLAPGGWCVVEDFYYLPPEDAPTAVGRALVEGYVNRLEERGADMKWGRRLPAAFGHAGLSLADVRVTPAGPGQTPADKELIDLRLRQEGHMLVERGLVTEEQLAEFLDYLGGPHTWDITTLEISVWGQLPPK